MGEPQAPNEQVAPVSLTEEESAMLQSEAMGSLRKAFRQTPIEDLLNDDDFSGKRQFRSLRRDYEAEASSSIWQREITLRAFIKRSNRQRGQYVGEGLRFIVPKKGSSRAPLSEHLIYYLNGELAPSAPANTTVARDNILRLSREIEENR